MLIQRIKVTNILSFGPNSQDLTLNSLKGTSRNSAVRGLFGLESGLRFVEAGRRYFMGQMGFYDLANRYAGLDAKNEPLQPVDERVVQPVSDFR